MCPIGKVYLRVNEVYVVSFKLYNIYVPEYARNPRVVQVFCVKANQYTT
jgi:hypothetical protein